MELEYQINPPGAVLRQYFRDRDRVSMIRGPLGSAKTFTSCLKILALMTEQAPNSDGVRPSRWFAVRNTYPDLQTTTIKDWMAVCGDLGDLSSGYPPTQDIEFELDDGTTVQSEMIFMALDREDSVKKLRGTQATGFWMNETKELPKPIIDMADLRHGRYPTLADGGVFATWHGMIGDYNSPDEDHWLYKLAEEARPEGWNFYTQPGGVIRKGESFAPNHEAENIKNLPDGYYVRGMQGKSKDWIKVNLANEYGFVQDGKPIHPEYNDSVHTAHDVLEPDYSLPLVIGIDFGLTPAATISQEVAGQWRVLDEVCTFDMGAKRFGKLLKKHLQKEYQGFDLVFWGDPAGEGRAQTDEKTPFMMLAAAGIEAFPTYTNDFDIRIGALDERLTTLDHGRPAILVSPKCKMLRKGLAGGYAYRRMKVAGDDRYHDKPDKNIYSHVCESLHYGMLGEGEGHKMLGGSESELDDPSYRINLKRPGSNDNSSSRGYRRAR